MNQVMTRFFGLAVLTSSSFVFGEAPSITGMTPLTGNAGTFVTLTGTNFSLANAPALTWVQTDGKNVSIPFFIPAADGKSARTAITLAATANGFFKLTDNLGQTTQSSLFTLNSTGPAPIVSSFTPSSGPVGTHVIISGSNFVDITSVSIGNVNVTWMPTPDGKIDAVVPQISTPTNNQVLVKTKLGQGAKLNFWFTLTFPPAISSFSPGVGAPGQTVTVSGTNLSSVTQVKFNGATASFSVLSATAIDAVIPASATSGPISVTNPSGTAPSASNFSVVPLCNPTIDPAKELTITSLSVVNDPRTVFTPSNPGHWSFGFLMGQLAGETDFVNPVITSNFVKAWLNQFAIVTTINSNPVAPRSTSSFVNAWPKLLGTTTLDFSKAPFRLLAITDRIDLQNATQAGEGRFVWGVLVPGTTSIQSWTVIFEYSLPLTPTLTQGAWALKWHELGALPFNTTGDDRFNAKLQSITDIFAATKFPGLGFVRDISLNQLRTNELALGSPWELREFRMNPVNGLLEQSTVKNNPDISFSTDSSKIQKLQTFVLGGATPPLPNSLPDGTPLLGGTAPVPSNNSGFKWFATSSDQKLRSFSANTCNGCHAGDTNTPFVHLSLRSASGTSFPSSFLNTDTNTNRVPILRSDLITNFCQ